MKVENLGSFIKNVYTLHTHTLHSPHIDFHFMCFSADAFDKRICWIVFLSEYVRKLSLSYFKGSVREK